MDDPDPHDDTSADYEQFETELLDADVVTPVPEDRVLVHEPSGTAFDSPTQLAVFHRGWTTACDADEEAE
ncbi:hypothetical protein ACFQJ5_18035 [Halomicroarcula sp. GCM10025324]|uniref:hypothetical protein n=1 Tax=Haloarcula TaxID=2237 RepID=UPI0023E8D74F|nr:hypothetical protein [Halomicroarcula sp. ZS-22-S1]